MTINSNHNVAFHILAKPAGPICNMNCSYCFYLEKGILYPGEKSFKIPPEVLDRFIYQYINSQDSPVVNFAWQGGEPALMGVDFFRKVVKLQKKYANGKSIGNAFQTNGVLLNEEWCSFFTENNFLIGLSLDGPAEIHNSYRVFGSGRPTFDKVMNGLELLKKYRVEFNTLTCVHHNNAGSGREVYNFLKKAGSRYMQFIPVAERHSAEQDSGLLNLLTPDDYKDAAVTSWSVEPEEYGTFMTDVFEEWIEEDVGKIFVQLFDVTLANWYGVPSGLCVFSETCGKSLALEHNGDLYSCDHYVFPEYNLGNMMDTPLRELVDSAFQTHFGEAKRSKLPKYCRECNFYFACYGGCLKHRFTKTPAGDYGLNYFCRGYKKFFGHVASYMEFMVNELRHQRSPGNVMRWKKQNSG